MEKLFDNSQGYTLFTDLGSKTIVSMQNAIAGEIQKMKDKNTDPEDIRSALKMFLNDDAMKKLESLF